MKCPIDQTDMEKGIITGNSGWMRIGIRSALGHMGSSLFGVTKMFAYKCPKCGKVELTTQGDNK